MSKSRFCRGSLSIGLLAAVFISVVGIARADVQIVRPLEGSTVRETVEIRVPVGSVPPGGFVSYSIDGNFLCAQASMSKDRANFAYGWNTKATDTKAGKTNDGQHTIEVQAHDASGNAVGQPKRITVFVKNNLSASDLPYEGLKLRYSHKKTTAHTYRFRYVIDLKKVNGETETAAAIGEGIEGMDGTVKKSVEDITSSTTALIQQKLLGNVRRYQSGRPVTDSSVRSKTAYFVEDTLGRPSKISTYKSGTPVAIAFPIMPEQYLRIGDVWTQTQKVLWDPLSDKSVKLNTTNTFEGLEWQNGHPCAKIRSTFSGSVSIPFSSILNKTVSISGESITYFSYKVGKVISVSTRATAKGSFDQSLISSLMQPAISAQSMAGQNSGTSGIPGMPGMPGMNRVPGMPGGIGAPGSRMPTMPAMPNMGLPTGPMGMGIGGPAGMEGIPGMPGMPSGPTGMPGRTGIPGMPGMPGMSGVPGMPGMSGQATQGPVDAEFEVREYIELAN